MMRSSTKIAAVVVVAVVAALSAYKYGLLANFDMYTYWDPSQPSENDVAMQGRSSMTWAEVSMSIPEDRGTVAVAGRRDDEDGNNKDVGDWNRSEPVVIFINGFNLFNEDYEDSATKWETSSSTCQNVRCRLTHDESERKTSDGVLHDCRVLLKRRKQIQRYHDKQVLFVMNMEPESRPEWRDPHITNMFDFKTGYSLRSGVPMLFGCGDFDGIDIIGSLITRFESGEIQPPTNRHGVVAMISNCDEFPTDRINVLKKMMKSLDVSSFGKCENNRHTTSTRKDVNWHQLKLDLFKDYKFGMAYENHKILYYVTEKIYSCLHMGVIPIYLGAPDVKEFVPEGSYINGADFANTAELIEHIKRVDSDPELYASYFKWNITSMKRLYEVHCSMPAYCRWCEMVSRLRHQYRLQK